MPAEQNGMKTCCTCQRKKPTTEFSKSKSRKDGLTYQCKPCRRKRSLGYTQSEQGRRIRRKWAKANHRKRKAAELKHNYDLTLAEFDRMYIAQKGCCAICGKHQLNLKRTLQVDHSHDTGKVRGLLCSNCNPALGSFEDNPDLLRRAAIYLEMDNAK